MGDVLYGRRCKLTVALPAGKSFTDTDSANQVEINGNDDPSKPGLRVQFRIKYNEEKEPNTSEVTVTNLSPKTRASLNAGAKGLKVTLEAGYATTGVTRIFRGDVRTIDELRDKADWQTKMKCGDGERSYRNARLSESFAAGTNGGDIIRKLAEATGLSMGNIPDVARQISKTFNQGYGVEGRAFDSLDRLAKSLGYRLSVQSETLQMLRPDETLALSIPEISPATGLIGSPEAGSPEKKGKPSLIKFTSLLIPTRPGARVHLKSARYDSDVRVKKCEFNGDTHGNEWYTVIEGTLLKG